MQFTNLLTLTQESLHKNQLGHGGCGPGVRDTRSINLTHTTHIGARIKSIDGLAVVVGGRAKNCTINTPLATTPKLAPLVAVLVGHRAQNCSTLVATLSYRGGGAQGTELLHPHALGRVIARERVPGAEHASHVSARWQHRVSTGSALWLHRVSKGMWIAGVSSGLDLFQHGGGIGSAQGQHCGCTGSAKACG